jgi:protein gp37
LIRECTHLDWQLLTKRPQRIVDNLPADWGPEGWPHVWLGTSVEDMRVADRVDHLRDIPAVVRFISYEPALGPLDDLDISGIDWIIYGGESGPGYRKEDKNWARVMHAKCSANGTAFFHKQSSGYRTELGIELDGKIVREYPTPRVPVSPGRLF